jgi:hypothetical protein
LKQNLKPSSFDLKKIMIALFNTNDGPQTDGFTVAVQLTSQMQ